MFKKIVILGAGNMGSWMADALCMDFEVAVYDVDKSRLKYLFNVQRFMELDEIREFEPELLINSVSLEKTIPVFRDVLPYLPDNCILSDITSVKNGLRDFYLESGRRFVSTHPMFGPTFANVRELVGQSAIIIQQSDEEGKKFFRSFYRSLGLNIFEYTFTEHDETTAYSLSIPFASTMVFAACMRKQQAPGTTFQKHMKIAQGLLSEDDYLISEIMFNRYSLDQVEKIHEKLEYLIGILKKRDSEEMIEFLNSLRTNIKD
jgi:prephenate dehydrogenase